jgi:hypothetical protein
MRQDSGLAASPRVLYILRVEREGMLSFCSSAVDGQALLRNGAPLWTVSVNSGRRHRMSSRGAKDDLPLTTRIEVLQ